MSALTNLVEILVRGKNQSNLSQASSEVNKLGDAAKKNTGHLSNMSRAAGALAGVGLVKFFRDANAEARQSAKVNADTANVIRSTGQAAHVTAGQVADLANAISNKTGIDDEQIQSGANMLLTFTNIRNEMGKGNDVFNQAVKINTDLATKMGVDTSKSAIQLGKALNDPIRGITALTRVGVTFSEQQRAQIRAMVDSGNTLGAQKIILAELNKEFGGTAAAQATAGEKMAVTFKNLNEAIGTMLLPVLDGLENKLSGVARFVTDNKNVIVPLVGVLGAFAAIVWTVNKATAVWESTTKAATSVLRIFTGAEVESSAVSGALAGKLSGLATVLGLLGIVVANGLGAQRELNDAHAADHGLSKSLTEAYKDFAHSADTSAKALATWALVGKDSGSAVQSVTLEAGRAIEKLGISQDALLAGVLGNDAAYKQLTDTIQAKGHVDKAAMTTLKDAHAAFGQHTTDVQQTADATNNAAGQSKTLTDQINALKQSSFSANNQLDLLNQTLDKLSNNAIDAQQLQLKLEDALGSVSDTLRGNGSSLEENTAKGRANQEWVLDQISTINSHAKAVGKQTGSIQRATQALQSDEDQLRRAAAAAGLNTRQVDALVRKYAATPRQVQTIIRASTAVASRQIAALQRQLDALADKTIGLNVYEHHYVNQVYQGTYAQNAAGGVFRGRAMQTGGVGGGLVGSMNERGAEIVRLPDGSMVYPAGQSAGMARDWGRPAPVTLEIHSGGTRLDDLLVEVLRRAIRVRGGNVQVAMGT